MRELLILGTPAEHFSAASIEKMRAAAGHEFDVVALPPDSEPMLRYAAFRTAEVIIGEPTGEELELAPQLKWLQITWAGADKYTKAPFFPPDVTLTCASGAYGVTISEHVIAMLLSLCRHLPAYRSYQHRTIHRFYRPERLLSGGTAVILGAGDIGSNTALRLKAFGMHTVGVCRTRKPLPPEFDEVCTLAEASRVLPLADVVICCLPGTAETYRYFDEARLRTLKQDAILVNVGRGTLIDSDALARVMAEGHLFGAALDVTDPEPLPKGHPLRKMRNVIITPHIAGIGLGAAADTERRITAICCDNIRRYCSGWPLRNQIDFQTGYRKR